MTLGRKLFKDRVIIGVRIRPGHTALTRMPVAAYSIATVRVNWITPPFAAAYAG
jgi:hypothetical protein